MQVLLYRILTGWRKRRKGAQRCEATPLSKAFKDRYVSSITLRGMVRETVPEGTTQFTRIRTGYKGLAKKNYRHEAVNHSAGEYTKGQAHTQGTESFWTSWFMFKRELAGVYRKMRKSAFNATWTSMREGAISARLPLSSR